MDKFSFFIVRMYKSVEQHFIINFIGSIFSEYLGQKWESCDKKLPN